MDDYERFVAMTGVAGPVEIVCTECLAERGITPMPGQAVMMSCDRCGFTQSQESALRNFQRLQEERKQGG